MKEKFIVVIDPALNVAEVECFENIKRLTQRDCLYFTPGLKEEPELYMIDPKDIFAIFIFGGSASLTKDIQWRIELEKWYRRCMSHKVPTISFCWGHQWIASLFGANVVKIPDIDEKILGKRRLTAKHNELFVDELQGELIVAHRFMVERAPKEAQKFLFSEEDYNEGFYYPDYKIISFQPHPEATLEFCNNNGIEVFSEKVSNYGRILILKCLEKLT